MQFAQCKCRSCPGSKHTWVLQNLLVSVDPHLSIGATQGTQWLDWELSLMLWVTYEMKQSGRELCLFEFPKMQFLIECGSPLLPAAWFSAPRASEWKIIPFIPWGWGCCGSCPADGGSGSDNKSCCSSRCGWQMAGGAGERWMPLRASSPAGYCHHQGADIHPFSDREQLRCW